MTATLVRPVAPPDLAGLLELVKQAGVGLTSLPPVRAELDKRIANSAASFAGAAPKAAEQFTFVMEELASGRIVGVCAVVSAVGLVDAWYAYRVGLVVHASRELGIFTSTPTLSLSNDHTGQSELCSLLLHPDFRRDRNASLLSKSRLLFIAAHRAVFARKLIAELRGVSDENGRSPFWEALGRRFFAMDYARADYLTGIGQKSFVAELMPKYPLYTTFLDAEAQSVIGKAHPQTEPARRLLESEGLRYEGHVDIFDAGPAVECDIDDVGAVRSSREYAARRGTPSGTTPWLVANPSREVFRALLVAGAPGDSGEYALSRQTLEALGLPDGGIVRAVALSPADRHG